MNLGIFYRFSKLLEVFLIDFTKHFSGGRGAVDPHVL
jgi:hypothetical protein